MVPIAPFGVFGYLFDASKGMVAALLIVGVLFILQTWIASDLERGMTFKNLDIVFYTIAGRAGV